MVRDEFKPGQIITFYSYKGGTGRSMAVANFACWLVKKFPALERRVLVMDWDLEAPGLHRYFAETAELAENLARPGIINYFDHIQTRLRDDRQLYERMEDEDGWKVVGEEFPLDEYLIRDVVAHVDFVKAGKYDAGYAELISTFNWVEFYHDYGAVFSAVRDFLLRTYEFCLIDSRTGFNDVSGICTMLLPEKLVTVFTPNRQNVSGVLDLAARAADYRLGSSDPRTLSIFPLPSRIENAEQKLMEYWQGQYERDFEATFQSIYKLDSCDLTKYFYDVQLPHVSFYSYGEEIALLREERGGSLSLSHHYELFFEKLVGLKFAWDMMEEPAMVSAPAGVDIIKESYMAPRARDADSGILVSYAQVDNHKLFAGQDGWVDTFHRVLDTRLRQFLGEQPRVWRDPKLSGVDVFSDAIFVRLTKINILVVIITPAYVRSESCLRELAEFYRAAEQTDDGVIETRRSPVFKVVKSPVDDRELPSSLSGLLGYKFYETDIETGRPREYSPEMTFPSFPQFIQKVDDLAWDIAEFVKHQDPARGGTLVPSRVYLAETTFDLTVQRDVIRRELQQRRYDVLPDRDLPVDAVAFREAVRSYLERCRLSIHLVGDKYGRILEGENRSVAEIQNELAAKRSGDPNFSRVIWMPIGLQPHDERQQDFVNRLRFDAGAQRGADLLESSIEGLKSIVQRRLASAPGQAKALAGDKAIRIYLICDGRDSGTIQPIEDYLFGLGFEIIVSAFEGDDAKTMQLHKENLLLCDAVLIYYGSGSQLWLQSKLTDLRKAQGWGRAEPVLVHAVLIGEPESDEKDRFRSHEALVIKAFGEFRPKSLQPFVDAIRLAKERSTTET